MTLPRLRRLSQAVFLALFVVLLLGTRFRAGEARLPYPVRIFLETDPLVGIANALATRALYRGLLWGLAILIPTFFLGRFYCGWICPLGTLHHVASSIRSRAKSGRRGIETNRYQRWQSFKYYLLIALLVAAVSGGALVGLVDPVSLAVRSLAVSILPALGLAMPFRQAFPLALVLLAILALNLRITRFWCRALCPLGALLGAASRWSVLGLEKRPGNCADCNRCLLHCQGGDDPIPGVPWRKAECHLCMNCVADCPDGGLRFRFSALPPQAPAPIEAPSLERRKVLTGLAAGASVLPLLRANAGLAAEAHERRIRPPAAVDERDFLARCIRCGECMKVCPRGALHPAFAEAGWEGIWTPVVVPRIGYCEPDCTLCGQVCPTGAIREFTAAQKAWVGPAADARPIRLGTAFFDRGRCLPWAMATECIVCEERCPTSPKAIYLRPAAVVDAAGGERRVRQPWLDPARCVGCGACEFACPLKDRPAVYVSSAGESRSPANQFLLGEPSRPPAWLPESGEAPAWTRTGGVREFAAADLWKYVDGDAERYLRAGVRRTLTAPYRHRDGVEAVADVYRMAGTEGASALYESESSAGSHPVSLGDSARSYGQSLTFRKGPFFVRLVAFQDAAGTERALVALARAVEARLSP